VLASHLGTMSQSLDPMHPALDGADLALDHLDGARRTRQPLLRRLHQEIRRRAHTGNQNEQHEQGAHDTRQPPAVQTLHCIREHHGKEKRQRDGNENFMPEVQHRGHGKRCEHGQGTGSAREILG
jgi:hypothetical protein